ncbi:MAG: hypothetical protein ABW195_09695 [Ilumatobacteraceae bacterium]
MTGVIVAHVGGLPVEEVLPAAVAAGTALLAALRLRLAANRRRPR